MKREFHRRNLPHLYYDEGIYFITYNLENSIFLDTLHKHMEENKNIFEEQKQHLFIKYDSLLHTANTDLTYLSIPEVIEITKQTIHFPDGKDYKLICYTIMPNHVHLVFELLKNNKGVCKIMQSIKRVSARRSNQFLKKKGKFWQDESYDRLVRDEVELYFVIKYILMNPVEAGLASDWKQWGHTYCNKNYLVI
jgi:REP element-mobilizing transposase RayT